MAKGDVPRKDRATPDEARERLINATIELLKTEPIPKVTTRRIAEVSGCVGIVTSLGLSGASLFAHHQLELVM